MTRNILSTRAATRRKILKFGAAASVLPWVHIRTAGAAGTCTVALWDHWVPATKDVMNKQLAEFAAKTKVELKTDYITSQGNQLLLTINAQAQARRGHDLMTIASWSVLDHADKLEVVDDIVNRMVGQYGQANAVSNYLGKFKGRWIGIPTSWGTQNKGPAARISLFKKHAGLDVQKMYPVPRGPETAEAKAWDMDAMLRAAEACHKGGNPFGIGLGTTSDSVDSAGSIFASFGAELVDKDGKIQIRSAAVRQALEYCQKLVRFLPDGVESWDDATNNRVLISGTSSFIYNPPSAWAVAVRDAPAIGADIWHLPPPAGPKGRFVPNIQFFWTVWQFAQNKSAAKDLAEFLMEPARVEARTVASFGYDLPPFEKMSQSAVWDNIGPPVGSVAHYPVRAEHNSVAHLAHMPAPPEIAVQIYNRGTLPSMLARLRTGQTIDQVINWGNRELEGFL